MIARQAFFRIVHPAELAFDYRIIGRTRRLATHARAQIRAAQWQQQHQAEAQRVKDLEREVKELRRANEILKLASAFFAQAELDRRFKS